LHYQANGGTKALERRGRLRSIKFDELPQKADLRRPTAETAGPTPTPVSTVIPTTAATTAAKPPSLTLDSPPRVTRK